MFNIKTRGGRNPNVELTKTFTELTWSKINALQSCMNTA
jgi:hypothetical protein